MTKGNVTRVVILDYRDTDRLLRKLYNGTRPKLVHILVCACGRRADLWDSESAWDGWQVLPHARCPFCLASHQESPAPEPYPNWARSHFAVLLRTIRSGRKDGV